MASKKEILGDLSSTYSGSEDILVEYGLLKPLKQPLLERGMNAELEEHLGYQKGDPAGRVGRIRAPAMVRKPCVVLMVR